MKTQVWFAPGRANLMGEHTDYNEGFVLPFALAQGVTATVTPRDDGLLVLRSKQVPDEPVTVAIDSLRPGTVTGWGAYPAGVAWALREVGLGVVGASIDIDSNLPVGAGVSSSAALECSVALALCSLSEVSVPRRRLASLAKLAENEFVGAPTGIIDQSAALLCAAGHAMLLDCGTRSTTQVPFSPRALGAVALVVDTRVPHALVSSEYAARRAECEAAARLLGVRALGRLGALGAVGALTHAAAVNGITDPVLRRRARHVITDSARARAVAEALLEIAKNAPSAAGAAGAAGALGALGAAGAAGGGMEARSGTGTEVCRYIGKLLDEGHASLRDDFEVSWPEADVTVDTAVAAGAYGAKMIGGGFGGSVLALVPLNRLAAVRGAVSDSYAERGWTPPEYLDAIPSPAGRRLR